MRSAGQQAGSSAVDAETGCVYTLSIASTNEMIPTGSVEVDAAAGSVFYNQPGVAVVTWDRAIGAACVDWHGWANPTEFAAANDAVIAALKRHRGTKSLGDCRNMKVIQKSDQDWINGVWFPKAIAAGLTRMAIVLAKSGLAQMIVEDLVSRVPGTTLDVGYFATPEEAVMWLARPTTSPPNARKTR
jgi:hypothetical protein